MAITLEKASAMQRDPSPSQIAIGLFDSRAAAEAAIADLEGAGFSSRDLGLAARNDNGEWSEFEVPQSEDEQQVGSTALAGAATGAGVGGLWALGIAAGILPALGPVIAGGVLSSILASAVTGAAAGGVLGAMIGLGLSEEEARFYEKEFSDGRVIVTVRAGDRFKEAAQVLITHGAYDVRAASAVGE